MRRMVRTILETYGYPRKGEEGIGKQKQRFWDFVFKYVVAAAALFGLGYELREFSPVLASALWLLALAIFFRGFLAWCDTTFKSVVLCTGAGAVLVVFLWLDCLWVRREWTPTFLYLTPSHELIDCERRAFFVNHSGFKGLQNVKIAIKDNNSGSVLEKDFETEIEPGPQDPDAPRYVWVKPSHPWDEDYTVTVTGTKFRSVQEIVLRSTGQNIQFAVGITTDSRRNPVMACRDRQLPQTVSLGQGAKDNCDIFMAASPGLLSKLQPKPYGYQGPNGSYSVVRMRELPSASELESQTEERHLTEFKQTVMKTKLSKYRGTRLLVLHTGGPKTLAYATEFYNFFHALRWRVEGPQLVPAGDERLVDVQVSLSGSYLSTPYPRAADFLSSLEGIKHRQRYVYDDSISPDLIVLWVGPKSPDNFRPDDCIPAVMRPKPGEPHTCEVVAQTTTLCPFVPQ
jgi:hypothetical protein